MHPPPRASTTAPSQGSNAYGPTGPMAVTVAKTNRGKIPATVS